MAHLFYKNGVQAARLRIVKILAKTNTNWYCTVGSVLYRGFTPPSIMCRPVGALRRVRVSATVTTPNRKLKPQRGDTL